MQQVIRIILLCVVAVGSSAQEEDEEELVTVSTLSNATSVELNMFGEAAEYLMELHHFFTEHERVRAQSKAEEILQDAFKQAFKNIAAIVEEAEDTGRPDILACATKAEEEIDQTLDEVRALLGKCYALETEIEEDVAKNSSNSDDEHEEALRQEVAEFLQVAVGILELVSEDTAAMIRRSAQLRQAISTHAIMLARNFQRTRFKVRNCVDMELEEAYKQADRLATEAAKCLLLTFHEEL